MKDGKFTSLALMGVFTVGFAQSSMTNATVDFGSTTTATKVSKDKTDDTNEGSDNVKMKGPSCTPPENVGEPVFIGKGKKSQLGGGVSVKEAVVVSASLLGIPGVILGAKNVAELFKERRNEDLPSKNSGKNSGQQQENNGGGSTLPSVTGNVSEKSNFWLYLIIGVAIILVIIIIVVVVVAFCFLITEKPKDIILCNARKNNFEKFFNDFADNGLRSNVKKNNVLLVKIFEITGEKKYGPEFTMKKLNSLFSLHCSCFKIIKGIFSKFENKEAPQNNYNKEQVVELANAFVILLKDSSDGLVKFLSAFNDQKYSQLIIDLIDKSYVIDGEHSALAGLCVLQSMLVLSSGDHPFDDNYDENIEKNLVGLFSAEDEVKRKCALNNFINFLSSIGKASKEDTTKAKGKAKNFLEVLLKHGDSLAASFARDNFDVNNFTNDLENDGFELNSFVKKWGLVENPLP